MESLVCSLRQKWIAKCTISMNICFSFIFIFYLLRLVWIDEFVAPNWNYYSLLMYFRIMTYFNKLIRKCKLHYFLLSLLLNFGRYWLWSVYVIKKKSKYLAIYVFRLKPTYFQFINALMRNIQADSKIGTLFNYTWHQLKIRKRRKKEKIEDRRKKK